MVELKVYKYFRLEALINSNFYLIPFARIKITVQKSNSDKTSQKSKVHIKQDLKLASASVRQIESKWNFLLKCNCTRIRINHINQRSQNIFQHESVLVVMELGPVWFEL